MSPFYIERDPSSKYAWTMIAVTGLYVGYHLVLWAVAGFPVTKI